MAETSDSSEFTVPDEVIVQELSNGEMVILHLSREAYFGLDEVGARLFELLRDGSNFGDAHHTMSDEYDVDAETLRRDLSDLIDTLLEHRLITTEG